MFVPPLSDFGPNQLVNQNQSSRYSLGAEQMLRETLYTKSELLDNLTLNYWGLMNVKFEIQIKFDEFFLSKYFCKL